MFPEEFTVAAEIDGFLIDFPNVRIHDNDASKCMKDYLIETHFTVISL